MIQLQNPLTLQDHVIVVVFHKKLLTMLFLLTNPTAECVLLVCSVFTSCRLGFSHLGSVSLGLKHLPPFFFVWIISCLLQFH